VNGYDAVMKLAREKPGWLPVIKVCLANDSGGEGFPARWIVDQLDRWPGPNFLPLVRAGILEKVEARSSRLDAGKADHLLAREVERRRIDRASSTTPLASA